MMKTPKLFKALSFLIWEWKTTSRINRLFLERKYGEAISLCDEILARNPNDYVAYYRKGLANESLNLLDEAIRCFERAEALVLSTKWKWFVSDYPSWIPIRISRLYRRKQNIDQAMYYANKSVLADDRRIAGLLWRALLKEHLRDYIGASEDLDEALRREPKDRTALEERDRLSDFIGDGRPEKRRH
jgi:tetratricopeptide (TPR) repeat protein